MSTCPTVLVKGHKGEPTMINESDYDPKKHTLHKDHAKTSTTEKAAKKVAHGKETKAQKKQRQADEKQAKKDAKAQQSEDAEAGVTSGPEDF